MSSANCESTEQLNMLAQRPSPAAPSPLPPHRRVAGNCQKNARLQRRQLRQGVCEASALLDVLAQVQRQAAGGQGGQANLASAAAVGKSKVTEVNARKTATCGITAAAVSCLAVALPSSSTCFSSLQPNQHRRPTGNKIHVL